MNEKNKSNWVENPQIEDIENRKKFKIDLEIVVIMAIIVISLSIALNSYSKYREQRQMEEVMKTYTNMMGVAGLQAIDANEQIRKSFEQLKNFQYK